MTKFRTSTVGVTSTPNYMGGRSFKQSVKEELIFATVTTFVEDSYYESKGERLARITALVKEIAVEDPIFVAKLALMTRKDFHMRSAFHVLVGELAKAHKGDSLVSNLIAVGAERPDDLSEIAAYVGKPMPNSVKKGIAKAYLKFNEYQLGKYKGDGKNYSIVDLFNLVHPKPTTKTKTLFTKVIKGTLKIPDTWETKLSAGEDHEDVWKQLLKEDKLGYMALLRNLRNIIQYSDNKTFTLALSRIADGERVAKSKQLPFRFLTAYKALDEMELPRRTGITFEDDKSNIEDRVTLAKKAIESAVLHSVENIPLLKGRTMILVDNSGSMRGDRGGSSLVSALGKTKTSDIGNLFALLYWTRAKNTFVGAFGDTLLVPKLDREKTLFENYEILDNTANHVGGGTETGIFTAIQSLIAGSVQTDRIVIFSDSQVGTGCNWYDTGRFKGADFNRLFEQYKKINPRVKVYSIDLKGYGNKLLSGGDVLLAGWSDKIFDLMAFFEKNDNLVSYVEDYDLDGDVPSGENQN